MKYKNPICVLGDSIAYGIGVPSEEYSWVGLLRKKFPGENIMNFSVGGASTEAGLEQLTHALAWQPKITVIQFGMNDHCIDVGGSRTVDLENYTKNINYFVEKLKEANSKVILVTNHQIIEGNDQSYYFRRHPKEEYKKFGGANAVIREYNDIMREVALSSHTGLVDMENISKSYDPYQFLRSMDNENFDDGVHPHILGAQIYAKYIGIEITNLLSSQASQR